MTWFVREAPDEAGVGMDPAKQYREEVSTESQEWIKEFLGKIGDSYRLNQNTFEKWTSKCCTWQKIIEKSFSPSFISHHSAENWLNNDRFSKLKTKKKNGVS